MKTGSRRPRPKTLAEAVFLEVGELIPRWSWYTTALGPHGASVPPPLSAICVLGDPSKPPGSYQFSLQRTTIRLAEMTHGDENCRPPLKTAN